MVNDCIFCKIVEGDIPSKKVYEDNNFIVIMDVSPASYGHLLVIPKEHCENVNALSDSLKGEIILLAAKMGERLKEKLNCSGYNILFNTGLSSGQTVFHCHGHIIPTYDDEGAVIKWENKKYNNNLDEEILKKIKF